MVVGSFFLRNFWSEDTPSSMLCLFYRRSDGLGWAADLMSSCVHVLQRFPSLMSSSLAFNMFAYPLYRCNP